MIITKLQKIKTARDFADSLDIALNDINAPRQHREELMDLQRYLDNEVERESTIAVITEINNASLTFEDLLSNDELDNDDITELKTEIEALTFKTQAMLDRYSAM